MLLTIKTFGNHILRKKAQPITEITDEIQQLARSMLDSMYAAQGVGLAAEQVGRTESLCVIDVPLEMEKEEYQKLNAAIVMPLILLNPEIQSATGKQRDNEGCLSFPEINVYITRAEKVSVTYTDLAGTRCTLTACGLLARALQHEIDHLNGVLLVDRMSLTQKAAVAGKLKRLRQSNAS